MSQPAVNLAAPPRRRVRRLPRAPEIGPGSDVGTYLVEARVGAGGFGAVFRARKGGELYALKVLDLEQVWEWAVREVVALSRVSHPNVVRLYGFWQWPDGRPRYMVVVMQYVEGQPLDAWARAHNPSALQALEVVLGVARGLAAVHQGRGVHRDVKPPNVVVREADGQAVLVDFGVSHWEGASQITGGVLPPGTPAYRSPEAWRYLLEHQGVLPQPPPYSARPSDDVYALGVTVYWLLTAREPFRVECREDMERVVSSEPEAPHVLNPRVPLELSQWCLSLLSKQPEARPDAAAICQQVEQWLTTRKGEAWEQPLCEPYSAHNLTTGLDGERADWPMPAEGSRRLPPRRGVRPPYAGALAMAPLPAEPAGLPAPLPSVAVPGPVEARRPHTEGERRRTRVALGLGLLVSLGMFAFARFTLRQEAPEARKGSGPVLPTSQIGWKVAPPLKPPQAERAAPLENEEAPAAPVDVGSTAPEDEAPVKTPQHKQPKGLGPAKKAAAVLGACTTMACSGPSTEVRPPAVTAEPCPQGSLEAMEQLGIRIGKDEADADFTWFNESARPIKVNEGWTTVRTGEPLGGLKSQAVLSGRIILTEKYAYGHFVQATTKQGKTYPVCVSWKSPRNDEGEVKSTLTLKAVREFE